MENTNGLPRCTGCGACVQACPVSGAISLAADGEGFYRPVTTDLCIHCGACRKICPELSLGAARSEPYETFWAARHRDPAVVRQSSSGGAFTALAQAVLAQGGVVYGVVWQGAQAVYRRARTLAEVEAMRGSKYIQTAPCPRLDEAFVQDAAAGIPVLYTGLSCKISGMRRLLARRKISADTVWFVDLVCTGVISPLLWQRERERYEQQYGSLVSYNFRDKCTGWQDYSLSVQLQNGTTRHRRRLLTPMGRYQGTPEAKGLCCDGCQYADVQKRQGDITLADFWNKQVLPPEWQDDKGISLLAATPKGEKLLLQAQQWLVRCQTTQAAVQNSAHISGAQQRESFWNDFSRNPYEDFRKRHGELPLRQKLLLGIIRPLLLRTKVLDWLRSRRGNKA
ncbi:Coenzyme F420 hydrogenase/dehydrogenase, beta subunit C-terminal domain [uncultured Subdoligranulum sp.]|uniref:Coenzyme F420 hydrogenase/dehydrogenase, beta subunit C-terminal domain n=1 Tax=uncultured Subdoligranulum sp. TaxID=512298 RepID=UPI0025E06CD7|nr:Coenzyme F420 hydrogenase/dehydrogenase, beta subunit C-terminal domain [uncultured Subdoligranulum sp.]